MRLIPMSVSELAWDLFYEPEALKHYRRWLAPGTQAEVRQNWCRVEISWERAERGQVVARLVRALPRAGVDTRGCTHLRFLGAINPGSALRLIVNGRVHVLKGGGGNAHYTVRIHGRRVRSLAFEAVAGDVGPAAMSLVWTALVDMRQDRIRLVRRGFYGDSWDGLLLPASERITPRVEMGLLFGADDLARIRRKSKTGLYKPWMQRLHSDAAKLLAVRPETLIDRFACQPLHYTRPPERDGLSGGGGYPCDWGRFDTLAFAGLLENDPRLLRIAARWMLSVASCEYWYNDFAGELPGTLWHHVSFMEAHLMEQMTLGLDWAGSAFTDEGRSVIRDSIFRRGMNRTQLDFMQPGSEYIRSMNQGIVFNTGRILGMLALCKAWPRAEGRLPEIRSDTREMFDNTFDADGGSVEGPGYWLYTLGAGLPGVIALARHDGCHPAELLPAKIAGAASYPAIFESTVKPGISLPIADSHGSPVCSGALAAMLAHVYPGPASTRLAAGALRRADQAWDEPVKAIIFGPPVLPRAEPLIPEFAVRRRAGHAVVCRPLRGVGLVRLQFYGAPGVGGSHSHDDRGNVLLEAGGEWVLADRGIGDYSNPMQNVKRPEAHNLLVPDMPDGSVPRQIIGHARDIVPRAAYRRGIFRAALDATDAWPKHVRRCRRSILSPAPGVFEITDELDLDRPLAATLHLQTPLKPGRGGNPLDLAGDRVRVTVEPEWSAEASFREEDMGMGARGEVIGHLRLRAAPARRHRLVTRLIVEARKGERR